MGYQPNFKPSNNYRQIERNLRRNLHKRPLTSFQELEKLMNPVKKNLVPSYNSLRNKLIKTQAQKGIPVLLQKY